MAFAAGHQAAVRAGNFSAFRDARQRCPKTVYLKWSLTGRAGAALEHNSSGDLRCSSNRWT